MIYPTLDQVEAADHEQLARWVRFLGTPGHGLMGEREEWVDVQLHEQIVLERILARFEWLGGMTPKISKRIGMKRP